MSGQVTGGCAAWSRRGGHWRASPQCRSSRRAARAGRAHSAVSQSSHAARMASPMSVGVGPRGASTAPGRHREGRAGHLAEEGGHARRDRALDVAAQARASFSRRASSSGSPPRMPAARRTRRPRCRRAAPRRARRPPRRCTSTGSRSARRTLSRSSRTRRDLPEPAGPVTSTAAGGGLLDAPFEHPSEGGELARRPRRGWAARAARARPSAARSRRG